MFSHCQKVIRVNRTEHLNIDILKLKEFVHAKANGISAIGRTQREAIHNLKTALNGGLST
jgi:hypothetical protein